MSWAFKELELLDSPRDRRRAEQITFKRQLRRTWWLGLCVVGAIAGLLTGVLPHLVFAPIATALSLPLTARAIGLAGGGCAGAIASLIWFGLSRRRRRQELRRYLREQGIPVCLHCGYDLRGQTAPRCPECGRPFDPALLRSSNPDAAPLESLK